MPRRRLSSSWGAGRPARIYTRGTILCFIAPCHERLGDRDRASEVLAEARRELGSQATGELAMFLQEAEREIGSSEKPSGSRNLPVFFPPASVSPR